MKPVTPPRPWYSLEMRVKDRLVRRLDSRLRWYGAKRWYTCLLHGPGGPVKRTVKAVRRVASHRILTVYPERPSPDYELFKICEVLNLAVTQDLGAKSDAAMYFHDLTHHNPDPAICALAKERKVINIRCTDVSKTRVEEAFTQVFGYGTFLDPETHRGLCVAKSEINARHDGRIIQCPAARQPNLVYQRVIDNTGGDGSLMVDYRIPVFEGQSPFVYLKHRKSEVRFLDADSFVTISRPEEAFSLDERQNISRFCETLGVDYGGLDVLRDRGDGRIYIVDANKTPWGPPKKTTIMQEDWALSRLATAFEKVFLSR